MFSMSHHTPKTNSKITLTSPSFAFVLHKKSRRRVNLILSVLVIFSMLASPFAGSIAATSSSGGHVSGVDENTAEAAAGIHQMLPLSPLSAASESQMLHDWTDPNLPVLTARMEVTPRRITVGDIFTVTLTINNRSDNRANNLSITIPLPNGVTGYPDPMPNGWTWRLARLDGNSRIVRTARLRLLQTPPGEAVVARARLTADGYTAPVTEVGGAVVVPPNLPAGTALFTPGVAALLRSPDGRIEVQVPPDAADRPLTLQQSYQPGSRNPIPPNPEVAGFKYGFPPFYLNATDAQGREFHHFSRPLTITINYTPQQLQALGLNEEDLSLLWFKGREQGQPASWWAPLITSVDARRHRITAFTDHFSTLQLGEDFRPSEAFIPSLKNWQVGLFRGNVNFEYEIQVPEGPGGIKPQFKLTYDSAQTDGKGGMRPKQQSGWVGKGWNLDVGYIALNKTVFDGTDLHYNLVLNGESHEVVRGDQRSPITCQPGRPCPDPANPTHWEWRSTSESFMRMRVDINGSPTNGRGGSLNGTPYPIYKWQVWTKDGTRFDFEEDVWWGWCLLENGMPSGQYLPHLQTYKWHLTRVVDTHGNTISYTYGRKNEHIPDGMCGLSGNVDVNAWVTEVTWGDNSNPAVPAEDRYRAQFVSSGRTIDTQIEQSPYQVGSGPTELRQLNQIKVSSMPTTTWQLVRQYDLTYATGSAEDPYLLSDSWSCGGSDICATDPDSKKITLKEIRLLGSDLIPTLPPLTFAYDHDPGPATSTYPKGSWNRLIRADNGQGGVATFNYDNIALVHTEYPGDERNLFKNNRRVNIRTFDDGITYSPPYTWTYAYTSPAYNTLGRELDKYGGKGPNQWPNSAAVYYNEFRDTGIGERDANRIRIANQRETEFRGHASVVERDPNGNETNHFFIQGDVPSCGYPGYPGDPITGDDILTNPCFIQMRDQEFLRGRESKTVRYAGTVATGTRLSEVQHDYTSHFYSLGGEHDPDPSREAVTGLWRAFPYEQSTRAIAIEGTSTPLTKTVEYTYDVSVFPNTSDHFGNLLSTRHKDHATAVEGTVLREITSTFKVLSNTTSYIVDRPKGEAIKNGQGQWLARTAYAYDGSYDPGAGLTLGDLTLVRKYHDMPLSPTPAVPIHSSDTRYTYDEYGNRKTITTYVDYGTAQSNDTGYGPPGGNYTGAMTQTTQYDTTFHAFPVQIIEPITSLTKSMGYDYHMGTLTRETDYNNIDTHARYDNLGRIKKLWKYGDSEILPTGVITYHDTLQPVKYAMELREVAGVANKYRMQYFFYDGMGRQIQTKQESVDNSQHIITNKRYDGLGQVTEESQPDYNSGPFDAYIDPGDPGIQLFRSTTYQYDALGRKTNVKAPDDTETFMTYSVVPDIASAKRGSVSTTDPNKHKTQHLSDSFGRMLEAREYSGKGTPEEPYDLDATTTYDYNPLDLLTTVTDQIGRANNRSTTVQYDTLGRKKQMTDLTMGTWIYTYYPNGNIKTQTDPKSQTITFDYDAMDRLTSKGYTPSGSGASATYTYDQTDPQFGYGLGRRTSTSRSNITIEITIESKYDQRGRQVEARYTGSGVPIPRTFQWAYDSADRNISIIYPQAEGHSEQVSYTYDAAWRPKSLCSDSTFEGICYADNVAPYTPLDQPTEVLMGNGVLNGYEYSDPMQRISRIKIGKSGIPANRTEILDRHYGYDDVGNVESLSWAIPTPSTTENQTFEYDYRDRLTKWLIENVTAETYSYDKVGNLTAKAGSSYGYTYDAPSGSGGPYATRVITPTQGSPIHYTYDANGNTNTTDESGNTRTYTWNADNQPITLERNNAPGQTENYTYDADGGRIVRSQGTQPSTTWTTYYMAGLWEEDHNNGNHRKTRLMYTFNGKVVAQREFDPNVQVPQNGLRGDYFNSNNLSNFQATRYDAQVDCNWWPGSCQPDPSLAAGPFSVDWTGQVTAVTTGTYTFSTESNRGVRLWVNGVLLVNNWVGQPILKWSGQAYLVGGQMYDIRLQYWDRAERGYVKLLWQPPNQNEEVIPTASLTPPERDLAPSQNPNANVVYLHGDHLGSVSVVTDWQGTQGQPQRQEFDPWGKVRQPPHPPAPRVTSTDFNYTGQRLDATGLLYYNARYYDPVLGRFVSPDSIVPGVESGKGGAAASIGAYQNHKLTVDFHEPGFVEGMQGENSLTLEKGFWFQLSGEDRQEVNDPWGPVNPQSLNRYAYVLNNPMRYTDPTGHWLLYEEDMRTTLILSNEETKQFADFLLTFEHLSDKALDIFDLLKFGPAIAKWLKDTLKVPAKFLTKFAAGFSGVGWVLLAAWALGEVVIGVAERGNSLAISVGWAAGSLAMSYGGASTSGGLGGIFEGYAPNVKSGPHYVRAPRPRYVPPPPRPCPPAPPCPQPYPVSIPGG